METCSMNERHRFNKPAHLWIKDAIQQQILSKTKMYCIILSSNYYSYLYISKPFYLLHYFYTMQAHNTIQDERYCITAFIPICKYVDIRKFLGCNACNKKTDTDNYKVFSCQQCHKKESISMLGLSTIYFITNICTPVFNLIQNFLCHFFRLLLHSMLQIAQVVSISQRSITTSQSCLGKQFMLYILPQLM